MLSILQISGAATQPWISNISYYVAINNPQYADAATCGLCLAYQGTEPAGPIPTTTAYALGTYPASSCLRQLYSAPTSRRLLVHVPQFVSCLLLKLRGHPPCTYARIVHDCT